ncbi:hypothetical protein GSI_07970 [Ganoderma sinense ZZ0214-1]|uniref:LysM domain-containing protein n=1 Tax=Ganoderma sinense ZZ0214-1 TaxID=1077348 RepID=A0A2G8S7P7_9APHY|nr:hypothetical protein GSI_07970 [Ganoderma sinense ZZ0214-1]
MSTARPVAHDRSARIVSPLTPVSRDLILAFDVWPESKPDEDVFVIDDEDELESDAEPEEERGSVASPSHREPTPPRTPDYSASVASLPRSVRSEAASAPDAETASQGEIQNTPGQPPKYFIRPDDTLLGISLRLGIDSCVLCRLNSLPPSTLRTTPHLLHTRVFLILPPSVRAPPPLTPAERALDEERKARLAIERAETRFQTMTKETDRDVAKAYIALANLPDHAEEYGDVKEYEKGKENDKGLRKRRGHSGESDPVGEGSTSLEGRAMDQYFDDADWESRERTGGRKVTIPSFPLAGSSRVVEKMAAGEQKPWWRWRN